MKENKIIHWLIRVRGTVQGVGFRPTVYKIAVQLELKGNVLNDGEGVVIEAWGVANQLQLFLSLLKRNSPPLARIEEIEVEELPFAPVPHSFSIIESTQGKVRTGVAADAATCVACLADVFDPLNRRYRYPFTNCTHCGPRLSIIKAIPYDRANTSMAHFLMCSDCQGEYDNPEDRRFHAQPNACPECGPQVTLVRAGGKEGAADGQCSGQDGEKCRLTDPDSSKDTHLPLRVNQPDDVERAASLIKNGEIVAIKGIGGFHIACDATNEEVVRRLRSRKQRFDKPFALMARDLDVARRHCSISDKEAELLQSHSAPIVVLNRRRSSDDWQEPIANSIAPNQITLGFMLPYSPLHHLLMEAIDKPIVLTSGNLSDEPQCVDNDDSMQRLGQIADWFLLHNRQIVNREDDSVFIVVGQKAVPLRRARGYAPAPLALPTGFENVPEILAMGGELKNTFCLLKGNHAIVSQHIGDLEEARTHSDYAKNLKLYSELFEHNPSRIAVDMHPEYLSSKAGRRLALENNLVLDEIQHHHAHIASCLADNRWGRSDGAVLGIALDGLGFGADGTFWGGEFLLADYSQYTRLGTFKPVALPGGAMAMKEPWRNTYAHILAGMGWSCYKSEFEHLELTSFFESKALGTFNSMLAGGINSPLASSCGRLFDAVAAAIGICRACASFEGQAAIELEAAVDIDALRNEDDSLCYPFTIECLKESGLPYLEPMAMWKSLLGDLVMRTDPGVMAARFHKGLVKAIVDMVRKLLVIHGEGIVDTVALSGGVFQNRILLELLQERFIALGFNVLTHHNVPANDGGLSLGQCVISAALHIQSQEQPHVSGYSRSNR